MQPAWILRWDQRRRIATVSTHCIHFTYAGQLEAKKRIVTHKGFAHIVSSREQPETQNDQQS